MDVQAGTQSSVAISIRLFAVCWTARNADDTRTTVRSAEFSSTGRGRVGPTSDDYLTTFMNSFISPSFTPVTFITHVSFTHLRVVPCYLSSVVCSHNKCRVYNNATVWGGAVIYHASTSLQGVPWWELHLKIGNFCVTKQRSESPHCSLTISPLSSGVTAGLGSRSGGGFWRPPLDRGAGARLFRGDLVSQ